MNTRNPQKVVNLALMLRKQGMHATWRIYSIMGCNRWQRVHRCTWKLPIKKNRLKLSSWLITWID